MKKIQALVIASVLTFLMGFQAFAATEIGLNLNWKYAENSRINTGKAVLYTTDSSDPKNITVAVNAGHGTRGGASEKTYCHPDGSGKVTEGSSGRGPVTAVAVAAGMSFTDGTGEAETSLELAELLQEKLLADGYDVLMIRSDSDVQLDNVARTVIANNRADCHISLHWDSTASDKGAFFMAAPDALHSMEPVKSFWKKHERLGESLIAGLREEDVKIYAGGVQEMDLTQSSYSTIPSVEMDLGDRASDHSQAQLERLAQGLLNGINTYYGF